MRPSDLPDFERPPLGEVVLGVQFSNPTGYSQIYAGEVWNLFRSQYPRVEEYQPLQPTFETFGPNAHAVSNQIAFLDGPLHDRYWFLKEDQSQLIQFQQDRLLHNWRKGDGSVPYPRFEKMVEQFEHEMRSLEQYCSKLAPQSLQINQCEISYVNQILVESSYQISDWLRFVQFDQTQPDGFSFSLRESIVSPDGTPQARLICEVGEARSVNGQRFITVALTVRGAPSAPTIEAAIGFLRENRSIIVKKFTSLTTDRAHQIWGRKK